MKKMLFFLFLLPFSVYSQDCGGLFSITADKYTKERTMRTQKAMYMKPHMANSVYAFDIDFTKFESKTISMMVRVYQIRTQGFSQTKNGKVASPLHKFDFLFDDGSSIVGISPNNKKVNGDGFYIFDLVNDDNGKKLFIHLKTKKLKSIRVDGIDKETNDKNSKYLQQLANCIETTNLD